MSGLLFLLFSSCAALDASAPGLTEASFRLDREEIAVVLGELRSAAKGVRIGPQGLRPRLAPTLRANPRYLFPALSDSAIARRVGNVSPMILNEEDRAAAALGLWIAENADTVLLEPSLRLDDRRVVAEWPGSRLILENSSGRMEILGSEDTTLPVRPLARFVTSDGYRLSVISTNDVHGALFSYDAPWARTEPRPKIGGMGALATYVRTVRTVAAAMGNPVLLLDAGDIYQGTPEGTLTRGHAMVPVLNALRYDAMTIGNHEFDHGRDNAAALVSSMDAPVLGANVFDTATGEIALGLAPGVVFDELDVGIVGLLTTEMPTLTFGANIAGLAFRSETETLRGWIDAYRGAGAKTIIALTHTGFGFDKNELAGVDGLDVIVGGHSHTPLETAVISNGVIVVQTGGRTSGVARLDLHLGPDGSVETHAYRLVTLYADAWPGDRAMDEIIATAMSGVTAEMSRLLGYADTAIPGSYREESPMGRLASDILREWADADVAIISGGGIRGGFLAGPITRRETFQVFPFGNELAIGDVRGDMLLRTIEHGATTERGRIQISGATVVVDTAAPEGSRARVEIAGKPLDPSARYRVATDAFLAQGGSGYFAGDKPEWEIHPEADLFELLSTHVEKVGTVYRDTVPRIRYLGRVTAPELDGKIR